MAINRKSYTTDVKLKVTRRVVDPGLGVTHVTRDMNMGASAARRWVEQYQAEHLGPRGIGKPITAEQQRIRQLAQEHRPLRSDNELLKKASVFFARELK